MRVRTRRSVVALALAVLVASVALVAAGATAEPGTQAATDRPWEPSVGYAQDGEGEYNATLNVTVGAQLSTVIETRARDVHTDVEDAGFVAAYERGDGEAAVAERFEELEGRAAAVRAEYEDRTAAYEDDDISRSAYARRLASLHDEAAHLRGSLRRVRSRADGLSQAARADAGIDEDALGAIAEDLDAVDSSGHRALLARYTGHDSGRVEFDVDAGIRIEATNDDGEGIRSIRRSGDDSRERTVERATALETARDALSAGRNWTLADDRFDGFDGDYHFEFRFRGEDAAGGAEVTVDGSSGEVIDLEEGILGLDHDRGWWSLGDHWDDKERDEVGDGDDRDPAEEQNLPDWLDERHDWLDDRRDWLDDRENRTVDRDGWIDGNPSLDRDGERPTAGADGDDRGWLDGDRDPDRGWFDDRNDTDETDERSHEYEFWERDDDSQNGSDGDGGDSDGGEGDDRDPDDGESDTDEPGVVDRDVDRDAGMNLTVAEGQVTPGASITVTVRVDGNASEGVPVSVNGVERTETAADGTATVTLPDRDDAVVVSAEADGREATLADEFESGTRGFWGR